MLKNMAQGHVASVGRMFSGDLCCMASAGHCIILAILTSSVKCHGKFTQTKIIGINPQRNQTFMTFSSFILKEIDAFRFILKQ